MSPLEVHVAIVEANLADSHTTASANKQVNEEMFLTANISSFQHQYQQQ